MTARRLIALIVGASLPLLWATAAFGHAVVQPAFAPAGEETRFRVLIPHGCSEGEPPPPPGTVVENTRLVSVEIPEGLTVTEVEDARGFETEQADDSVTWSDGNLENGDPGEFFFTALVETEDGDPITFNVFQECTDDLSYRWAGAQDDATPAPTIVTGVAPAAAEAEAEGDDDAAADEAATESAEPTEEPTDEPTEDATAAPDAAAGSDTEPAPTGGVATGAGGTATNPVPLLLGGLGLALLGAAGLVRRNRTA